MADEKKSKIDIAHPPHGLSTVHGPKEKPKTEKKKSDY